MDLKALRWEVINSRGEIPLTRDDHTAVLYEGSMVIFGGFVMGSGTGERTNDIYRYHFKDNKWEKVTMLGVYTPKARAGHSAVIVGDTMVIFGGRDEDNNKLNDLWLFNFSTYFWEPIRVDDPLPLPRSGHSACMYKDMMLIFGGIHEVTKELNDMYLFDFRNRRWIVFFEELHSPVFYNRTSIHSPEVSPSNKNSNVGQRKSEFFKLDYGRPGTQGGTHMSLNNGLNSPSKTGKFFH